MAKYIPNEMVKQYQGKICGHSDIYFAERNGTLYTGKICNPYKGEPTATQIQIQTKFKQASQAAKTALADPEQRETLTTAFKKQKRYKTLFGFAFAQEYAKLAA